MKCYQCDKRAIWKNEIDGGTFALCLDCQLKFTQIQDIKLAECERQMNYWNDEIAHSVGMPPQGARFPERRPIYIGAGTMNNINISNSTVGVVNTGITQDIDIAITTLNKGGQKDLALAIQNLSNAILSSNDITDIQRNEIIESLSVITEESTKPEQERRKSVLLNTMSVIERSINGISSLVTLYEPLKHLIKSMGI